MTAAEYTEQVGTPAPIFSESEIADRFAERHSKTLCYVGAWKRWYLYDGKCWREEKTLLAFDLVRALCRELARQCNKASEAKALLSNKTIAAVENIAKTDRHFAATIDQWDKDPWLLNTPDGVIDLRTGRLKPHVPEYYQTKITAVGPGSQCPLWEKHLNRIMNGDAELIAFLQRGLGYSLTGSVQEHALFFGHGGGANGKGTTIETVARILGDYARTAPMETFTSSSTDRHPTELAMLRGARFVTAGETEQGRKWAESRIKSLTGGDAISARFMRADFFEYVPQFKLWLTGNHKPGLKSVDEAIRRRFNLVPFTVTIPEKERDKELPEKLKAEWSGILRWMVEGCLSWQRDGLAPPKAVKDATDAYLASQDILGLWFDENCVRDRKGQLRLAQLYENFKVWAENSGEFVVSKKRFAEMLETASEAFGIEKVPDMFVDGTHGVGFKGVRFRANSMPHADRREPPRNPGPM